MPWGTACSSGPHALLLPPSIHLSVRLSAHCRHSPALSDVELCTHCQALLPPTCPPIYPLSAPQAFVGEICPPGEMSPPACFPTQQNGSGRALHLQIHHPRGAG